MTLSLAAVFLPLVFMTGLVGRIFREFAITIVVAILASGLVSLTLTPLMCARLLRPARPRRATDLDRADDRRRRAPRPGDLRPVALVLPAPPLGRRLLIWVDLSRRDGRAFMIVPKAFLPVGDSSFIFGVLIAPEGSSPEQMQQVQDQADR